MNELTPSPLLFWEPVVMASGDSREAAVFLAQLEHLQYITFKLDGRRMTDAQDLFDEFNAVLDVGEYFHGSWDGLSEVLRELEWAPSESGYVLFIENPELILSKLPERRGTFLSILRFAADHWLQPIEPNWIDAHEPLIFRTVMLRAKAEPPPSWWLASLPTVSLKIS